MIKKFLIAFAAGGGLFCGSVKAQEAPVQIIGGNNVSARANPIQGVLGIGTKLKLTENLAITGALRYVAFVYDEDSDYLENLTEVGIGLKLYF